MFIIILTACGSPSPEEELASAEQQREELGEMLQTESVALERNRERLEILENEISQVETSQNDEDVQAYMAIVEEYSSSLISELESLGTLIEEARQTEELSEVQDDIEIIIQDIEETIDTYEEEVIEIELNETLMRRHNSLQLAHEAFPAALAHIKNGAEDDNMDGVEEGVSALNGISEFY
ncbi:hypothetical protein [Lacicoccus alkaliphilus]